MFLKFIIQCVISVALGLCYGWCQASEIPWAEHLCMRIDEEIRVEYNRESFESAYQRVKNIYVESRESFSDAIQYIEEFEGTDLDENAPKRW